MRARRGRGASPVRVLMITPDFPPRPGGIQLVAHRLAVHLERAITEIHTLGAPGARDWDAAQRLDVHRVAAGRNHRVAILRLNAAAARAALRFQPDVVLALHIVAAPAAAAIRRALRAPVITYVHAREVPASPMLASFAMRHSDRIVAVSRYTASLAAAAGADEQRLVVIPPGVDWRAPSQRPKFAVPTVLTVARLEDRYKGHDVMVRAMPLVRSRVPAAQWVIVGDGSLREHVERLAHAHGVSEAIRMCGTVSDDERDAWLDRAHVFAMPSRVPAHGRAGEGFGIAYLEAGVHELPVVAGSVGGAVDAVVDGQTGLLVDPTDHVQVGEAISRLLIDPAPAARMGAAGSKRARKFAWPVIAGRLERLIEEAIAER